MIYTMTGGRGGGAGGRQWMGTAGNGDDDGGLC
jgi:hypothetical protein